MRYKLKNTPSAKIGRASCAGYGLMDISPASWRTSEESPSCSIKKSSKPEVSMMPPPPSEAIAPPSWP
jgi:hypothetical protein